MTGIEPAHGGFTIHCLDPLGYIRPILCLNYQLLNILNINFIKHNYFIYYQLYLFLRNQLYLINYSLRPAILDLLSHFTKIKKSVKMKEREWYFYWIALIIIFKLSLLSNDYFLCSTTNFYMETTKSIYKG